MKKLTWALVGLISLIVSTTSFAAKPVVVLEINNSIGPAMQDYIQRGIESAKEKQAAVIIFRMNTPGGLETSMRGINQSILTSPIPVVTYVSPQGARAASAGTFILYASHIAAMAPGTNVGAASPVNMGGGKNDPIMQKKHLSDSVAYIRSLAELRHRNAQWGELAVREGVSLSANEALNQQVINFIATDMSDLLKKLNAYSVKTLNSTYVIQTQDAATINMLPDWRTKFLSIITDPSIAYILLLMGIYGLFFELMTPGLVLPGVAGVISLLVGLYALQLLPISYVGLTLLLCGIACMVAEIFISSFGIVGIGGLIAFVTGSMMLLDSSVPGFRIAWSVILMMTLLSIGFLFLLLWLTVGSLRKPIITGREGLIGMIGEVVEHYPSYTLIRVHGEIWNAHSHSPLQVGQRIKVKKLPISDC